MNKISLAFLVLLVAGCTPSTNEEVGPTYSVSALESTETQYSFGEDLEIGAKVADKIFTFTKSSSEASADSTVQLSTLDNSFLLVSATGCNRQLVKITDKCLVKVRFNKTKESGNHVGTLSVGTGAGVFNLSLSASVKAAPEVPEEPVQGLGFTLTEGTTPIEASLSFGELEAKKTLQKIITLTNTSTKNLSPAVALTGDSNFVLTSNGCGSVLAGKKVCYIKVTFKADMVAPTTPVTKTANLNIIGSSSLTLTGNLKSEEQIINDPATTPALFKLYEGSTEVGSNIDFGSIPWASSPSKVLTIKNEGGLAATPVIAVSGSDFSITLTGCASLKPASSCFVRLFAKAQSSSGVGSLSLESTSVALSYSSTPPNAQPLVCLPTEHKEGEVCVSNERLCSSLPTGATAGKESYVDGAWSSCEATSCDSSYFLDSGGCSVAQRSCSTLPEGATAGVENYVDGSWSSCQVSSCESSYHLSSNLCESNIRSCSNLPLGAESGEETYSEGSWSSCVATSCDSSHFLDNGVCAAAERACSTLPSGVTAGHEIYTNGQWSSCVAESCESSYTLQNGSCNAKIVITDFNSVDTGSCTVATTHPTSDSNRTSCETTKSFTWRTSTPTCSGTYPACTTGCGKIGLSNSCKALWTANTCTDNLNAVANLSQANCYARPGTWSAVENTTQGSSDVFFKASDGKVYFRSQGMLGYKLQVSSGTQESTITLLQSSSSEDFKNFAEFGGRVYFSSSNAAAGQFLWSTDGSVMGTNPVVNLCSTTNCSNPVKPFALSDALYVVVDGNDYYSSGIYFSSTPTVSSSYTIVSGMSLFNPINYSYWSWAATKDILFFAASNATVGGEMFKVQSGAVSLIKDVVAGANSSTDIPTIVILDYDTNKIIYATTNASSSTTNLTATDGTAGGTIQIAGGLLSYYQSQYLTRNASVSVGSYLYLPLQTSANGTELYRISKQSPHIPELVKDIYTGASSSNPKLFGTLGGKLIFSATDATNGTELWSSDPSSIATTAMIGSGLSAGSASSTISGSSNLPLPYFGDKLYNGVLGNKMYLVINTSLYSLSESLVFESISLPGVVLYSDSFVLPIGPAGSEALMIRQNSATLGREVLFYRP